MKYIPLLFMICLLAGLFCGCIDQSTGPASVNQTGKPTVALPATGNFSTLKSDAEDLFYWGVDLSYAADNEVDQENWTRMENYFRFADEKLLEAEAAFNEAEKFAESPQQVQYTRVMVEAARNWIESNKFERDAVKELRSSTPNTTYAYELFNQSTYLSQVAEEAVTQAEEKIAR